MSDFFANLAARARDSKGAVRPRLPSRFETFDSARAAPFDAPRELTIEVEARDAAAPPAPVPDRVAGEAAMPIAASPAGAVAPAAVARMTPEPIAAALAAPPPRDVAPPVAAAIVVPARATAPVPVFPRSAPPTVPGADERRVQPRVDAPVEHAAESRVRRDPTVREPADDASRRAAPRDRASGEPERAPARGAVRTTPELVPAAARVAREPSAPAILPRVVRAAPQRTPLPAPPPAAETTIHVSIGRIEVRATPPPADRRREAAPPAVMSLGEYLSSRAERAR